MPQPAEVEGAHGQLLAEYQAAHGRLQDAVASARGSDAQQLDQSLGALRGIFEQLDVDTRGFVSATIPSIYQVGAASTGMFTSWNQTSLEAVQALANQNYNDLLSTNQMVEGTTKRALRDLARAGALDVVAGGKPVARAGRDLANLIQDAHGRVMTVTYSNGARHSLADWADTALRTQTALAYNAGAIAQYREYGIEWVELSDGADCGLTSHDDPELANGLVVPLEVAEEYPLAHPRCGRTLIPRPDIESADEADRANAERDPDELQRQAELERERAAKGTLTGQRFKVDTETPRVASRARRARQPRTASKTRTATGGRVPHTPRGQGPPDWSASSSSSDQQMAMVDRELPVDHLTDSERAAAETYGDPANAARINSNARQGHVDPDDLDTVIDLTRAISRGAIPRDMVLYRATDDFLGFETLGPAKFAVFALTDHGFMSTSVGAVSERYRGEAVHWEISVKTGYPALNMHLIQQGTAWEDEFEVLLPADTTLVLDGPPVYDGSRWLVKAHVE